MKYVMCIVRLRMLGLLLQLDAPSNTWTGIRIMNATTNMLYVEFRNRNNVSSPANTNWTEVYDLNADPWQFNNLQHTLPSPVMLQLREELYAVSNCSFAQCP
jgi:hypothetical protein